MAPLTYRLDAALDVLDCKIVPREQCSSPEAFAMGNDIKDKPWTPCRVFEEEKQ